MKDVIALLILLGFSFISFCQNDTCLVHSEIGISFPPVANSGQRDFSQQHLNTLGIKKIRFAEDWSFREPTPGNFNWSPLDERISWALTNKLRNSSNHSI